MLLFDQEQESTIGEIKRDREGRKFSGVFLIKDVEVRKGKDGNYLSFRLMDKTGVIIGTFFGGRINGEDFSRQDIKEGMLKEGIYRVRLRTQTDRSNVVVESLERSEGREEDFFIVPRAIYPTKESLKTEFDILAEQNIKTEEGMRLYRLFWNKFGEEFLKARGGVKKHHEGEGGLALHTYMVVKIALFLGELYSLDREVIFLAGLLHDLGKIYEIGEGEFTRDGDLLGHTVISLLRTEELCKIAGYSGKKRANLLHCIASHHGELQFGAPVSPKTLEAFVLHIADLADSKIYQFFKAISEIGEGEESSGYFKDLARRVYLLDEE